MTESIPTPDDLMKLEDKLHGLEEATQRARSAAEAADPIRDGSYAGDASKAPLVDTPDLDDAEQAAVPVTERWVSDSDNDL